MVLLIAVLIWLGSPTSAGAAPAALDLQAGQALYATQCALCHGPSGQGDGPSAAGFATKPSNLADGRLMNGLPDDFLANVIKHGGSVEGLSPGIPAFVPYLRRAHITPAILYMRSSAFAL